MSNCYNAYTECNDGCEGDEECMVGCEESMNECIESSAQQVAECIDSCDTGAAECYLNLTNEFDLCMVNAVDEYEYCGMSCQEDYEECMDEDENSFEIQEIFMVLHDYEEQVSGFQFTIESRTEEMCENLDYSDCMETGCEWDDEQDECRHAWWVEYETSVDIYSFQFNIEAQFPDCGFQVTNGGGNGILGDVDMIIEFTYDEGQGDPIYISTITGTAGEGPNNYIPAGTSGLLTSFGWSSGGGNELCINNISAQDSSGEEIESTSDQTCAIYKDGECGDDEWACFDDMPEPPFEGEPTPEEACDWLNNVAFPSGTLSDCEWHTLTQWGEWIASEFPGCELDMCNAYIAEEDCSPATPTDDANDYVIGISDTLDMLIAIGETVDCENLGESDCESLDGCEWENDNCQNGCEEAVEYIISEIFESEILVNFDSTGSCVEPFEAFAPFLEEIVPNCSGLTAFSQAARNVAEAGCVSWGGPAEDCEWISETCVSEETMGMYSYQVPQNYYLHSNYPNPFNPITTLRYELPGQAQVTLTVYDLMGREVTQLVNTTQEAGYRSVQWNATDMHGKPVSAGVYLYQIRAGEFIQTRKMVLLK